MDKLKSILPWVGIILLVLGGYVRMELRFAALEDRGAWEEKVDRKLSLHWALIMSSFEECQRSSGGEETWSEHISHCRKAAWE